MTRIVSLIASSTEIACALGLEDQLVGRSHECDFPESVKRLPVCTEPKFDVHGSSSEIDQRVKALLRDALSVYRVHPDLLKQLRPEVILTQTQCEVCAVSLKDVEEVVGDWISSHPRIVSLAPNALADVWADIQRVAEALNVPERGQELVYQLKDRMAALSLKARQQSKRPTVACIEWIEPLMAAGNWMPELVEMACGINLFGEAGKHAPWMTWEQLCEKDPEVIVLLPCGFDIERIQQEMPLLTQKPEWGRLQAVQAGRVFLTDGNQYFNRPGPRLVESLEILAELLHPETFRFGHEGKGWRRWQGKEAPPGSSWLDRLEIVRGDITKLAVDAIVNAARPSLLGGGGVDGAIHRAAGRDLLAECATLGGCPTGEARITKGYNLPAKHVIHTVGPIWDGGEAGEDADLASCYRNCLALLVQSGLRTVAFCSISTGAYGFPLDRARSIALREIRSFFERNTTVEKVTVICFEEDVYQSYLAGVEEMRGGSA